MAARSSGRDLTVSNASDAARGRLEQRAAAGCEREHDARGTQCGDHRGGLGPADDHARLGVAEEIGELALLIAGVERQEHESGAQAAEIERQRLPALVDLRGDAVAVHAAGIAQHVGDSRRHALEVVVVDDRAVGDQQAGLFRVFGEMVGQEAVEIGVHGERRGARAAARLPPGVAIAGRQVDREDRRESISSGLRRRGRRGSARCARSSRSERPNTRRRRSRHAGPGN